MTHADIVEDFSGMSGAKFSDDLWKTRNGDPAKIYSLVDEDGNTFLRARAEGISIQLFRKKGWNIKDNPVLSWKWRVNEFPSGPQVKNDNPVAIYVVFPARWFMPETIKYVWNAALDKDRIIRKKENFPGMVIRSGTADKGKWIMEERNVLEDYKKLFGREPPNPVAFGFLTDGDDTKGKSWGDYDHFKVQSKLSEPIQVPAVVPTPVVTKPEVKKEEPKKAPAPVPTSPKK